MHFLARNKLKRIIWVQPSAFLANCLGKIGHALFSGHCLFALISLVFYSWLDLSAKGCTFRGASLELPEGGLCVHLYYFLATSVPWSMFRCVQRKGKRILCLLLPCANGLDFFIFFSIFVCVRCTGIIHMTDAHGMGTGRQGFLCAQMVAVEIEPSC